MKRTILALATSVGIVLGQPVLADPAPFDLSGPSLRISVTRQGTTLPISGVPQLAAGDKLRVEAELPADETTHYLLVAGFLRDPTNPPPDKWFEKSASWKRSGHGGGTIDLTIPVGAQHVVLFLAPATGGDFTTLREAVESRPGAFVRAAQDLEQASLDRGRYDAYLTAIRKAATSAPDALANVAPVVASSLHIKINEDCLQRQPEFQAACLLDAKQSVVLGNDDASGSSSLSGAAADLVLNLSATPAGGLGYYSPYISTIRDIVGIFGAMHTAKYQYIPALGVPSGGLLTLVLNTPPSFANPKSVLMAALPEIKAAQPPVLLKSSTAPAPCFGAKQPLLPLVIGPLFFATAYAHDLALRVHLPEGGKLDLPLTPDATRGGLAFGPPVSMPAGLTGELSATVHGMWGFEPFVGPEVKLQTAGGWQWQPTATTKSDGRQLLSGAPAACISAVTVTTAHGGTQPASWKISDEHEIAVTLPAMGEKLEPVTLAIVGPEGTVPARVTIAPPAKTPPPVAQIVARSSEPPRGDQALPVAIVLDSSDEIPADARLSFTLKASGKDLFTGHETVEIGTADGDDTVKLALGNGLTRVDSAAMVASLTPAQALGTSTFGPLRARLVRGGVAGDWLSLGTLVRLPRLKQFACPANRSLACTLTGDGLYLLASVSTKPDFDNATSVPEGYPGFTLTMPRPAADGIVFVRLHDAPEVVNRMRLVDALAAPK